MAMGAPSPSMSISPSLDSAALSLIADSSLTACASRLCSLPLLFYYRFASSLLDQASSLKNAFSLQEGKDQKQLQRQNIYILLFRYSTLYIEHISKHKQFNNDDALLVQNKIKHQKKVVEVLDEIEQLKKIIDKQAEAAKRRQEQQTDQDPKLKVDVATSCHFQHFLQRTTLHTPERPGRRLHPLTEASA